MARSIDRFGRYARPAEFSVMEGYSSGLRGLFAKEVWRKSTIGSNPIPSAKFTARSLTIGITIRALTISTLTIITLTKEYV